MNEEFDFESHTRARFGETLHLDVKKDPTLMKELKTIFAKVGGASCKDETKRGGDWECRIEAVKGVMVRGKTTIQFYLSDDFNKLKGEELKAMKRLSGDLYKYSAIRLSFDKGAYVVSDLSDNTRTTVQTQGYETKVVIDNPYECAIIIQRDEPYTEVICRQ